MEWGTWQCIGGVQAPASDTPDDSEAARVGTTATAVADFTQCTSLNIRERGESSTEGDVEHPPRTDNRGKEPELLGLCHDLFGSSQVVFATQAQVPTPEDCSNTRTVRLLNRKPVMQWTPRCLLQPGFVMVALFLMQASITGDRGK